MTLPLGNNSKKRKMKKNFILLLICIAFPALFAFHSSNPAESPQEPWKPEQLMNPADLAKNINNPMARKYKIFNIGPSGAIKGSIEIGAAEHKANLGQLFVELQDLDRDEPIVVYCGCCPFNVCPNIRPAFQALNELGFSNHYLLNLSENLKVDWINKGYPME